MYIHGPLVHGPQCKKRYVFFFLQNKRASYYIVQMQQEIFAPFTCKALVIARPGCFKRVSLTLTLNEIRFKHPHALNIIARSFRA